MCVCSENMVHHHLFVAVLTALISFVPIATATTYTIDMDHAEHFCGVQTNTYPMSGAGAPCSLSSPRWKGISGLGLNPLNKLAYAIDADGMTVTSVPIPDISTGNVEVVAGVMGCTSRNACMGTATGTLSATRFNTPHGLLMNAQLMPKFYVGDFANYRLVELDLNTQTSYIYIGTNSAGSKVDANDFNNLMRTSAVMYYMYDAAVTSDYMLPGHGSRFQPKVSRTTDMTTLLIAVNYGCRTNAHYNGIVFCGYDGF
eukprot:PhM_4_TR12714/c0_g1_i1/m.35362